MKRACSVLILFVAFAAVALSAQEKPSFAGTWKLAPDSTPDMMTPPQMAVVVDGATMTVTNSSDMGEFKTIYKLDGTEARSPIEFNGNSIDRLTKTAWDGGKLVMTTKAEFNGQAFETKAIWSLTPDGSLFIEATRPDFQGGGGPVTTKTTYKKS